MTILPLAVMMACHLTEEQEAEALFAQQSQEAMEALRQYQAAIATSTVGQEVAEAIVACLEREQVHLYGLQLSVMVHPDGLRLSELAAADPLLAPTVQATCLQDVIGAARPTVNPLLAAAEPPVHEAHELTLFRGAAAPARVASSPILLLHVSEEVQRTPMALVTDAVSIVGTPWAQLKLPAALLACEASGLPESADPLLLEFLLVSPGQGLEPAVCRLEDGGARSPYTDCLCAALKQGLIDEAALPVIDELTISAVTEDGRTVTSTLETTPTPSSRRLWLLRQTEDGETRYRSHAFPQASSR